MENAYQDPKAAQNYIAFLDSPNGKIQRWILQDAILKALPASSDITILDAGCGIGWLADKLISDNHKTYACDSSTALINEGKSRYPKVEFSNAGLQNSLPYPDDFFDCVILNMAASDIADLAAVMKNLSAKLKTNGKLIMTIPNPFYTYPVAVWKRSPLDILLGRKPTLKIVKPYQQYKNIALSFGGDQKRQNVKIISNFYTLGDYQASASSAGFCPAKITELKSQTDSLQFDLNYQMFRYPLMLILEFSKCS